MTSTPRSDAAWASDADSDPRQDGRHLPQLDGLRGIAIIAVLLFHFGAASGGYLGVDVFFVLSGFVVSNNIIRRTASPGWFRVFWIRRVSRLMPVLCVFIIALAAAWSIDGDLSSAQAVGLVSGLTMQYNLGDVLLGAGGLGMVPLWSLSVEFHFYVIAPALLLFAGTVTSLRSRATRSGRRAVALLVAAGAVTAFRLGLLAGTSISERSIYLSSITRLDGLLIGASLAVLPFAWLHRFRVGPLARPAFVVVIGLLVASPKWYEAPFLTLGPIDLALQFAVVALIMAICLGQMPGKLDRLLGSRALVLVGQRSYSLYLWHFAVGVAWIAGGSEVFQGPWTFLAQVSASAAIAELSYRLVEAPARSFINQLASV